MQTFSATPGLEICTNMRWITKLPPQHRPTVRRHSAAADAAAAAAPCAAAVAIRRNAAAVRGVRCRAATAPNTSSSGGSSSDSGPEQPAAPQTAPEASTSSSSSSSSSSAQFEFSEPELRQLWDSVSRSLLKLGKAGLSPSHLNSLRELLTAHKLVKVDLNGARDEQQVQQQAEDVERQLEGTGALLQVKGRTILLGSSGSSSEQLLALAEASAASTALWRAKRQMKRAEAAAKRDGA